MTMNIGWDTPIVTGNPYYKVRRGYAAYASKSMAEDPMIDRVRLQNYGPIGSMDWKNLGRINLVLGANGSGKTFLLKALYSAMRTLEEYKRGDEKKTASEILADKLYWTFQTDRIGDLVSKNAESPLSFDFEFDKKEFHYSFGKDTTKQIASLENHVEVRSSNSLFLPAKEVLTLHRSILKSREVDKMFGFDDTYLDLARALRQSTKGKGDHFDSFNVARGRLEKLLGGKVEYEESSDKWLFKKGNQKFQIGVTAEGIKKIAILDTLLKNRYLDKKSILFIDEPEAALHPRAISDLLDIIWILSDCGIQFFLASHSYFVVKKLFLIAQEKNISIPVISECDGRWHTDDLRLGMPDNPVIDESIRLYDEEVGLSLS